MKGADVPKPTPHGTTNGYSNYRCRCVPCKAAKAAWKRAYYQANRERNRAEAKAWQEAHREKNRAWSSAWTRANPEADAFRTHRRRARQMEADTRLVTLREWLRLCERYHGRCAFCGAASKLTQDHVIPISRGGRHAIGNLLPACLTCNSSKGSKLLTEWRSARLVVTG